MTDDQLIGLKIHNEKINHMTTESLRTALFSLMKNMDYRSIRITDICKKAGVSRTAFYRNFLSKDDLLECAVEEYTSELVLEIGSPFRESTTEKWYEAMFERVKEHESDLRTLFRSGLKYKYLSIVNDLVLHDPLISERSRYVRVFWAGAVVNVIIDWIDGGLKESVQNLAAYCTSCLKVK
ncbi:MAG: TetR/AcrR family transcriptional regulator [Candidatus Borkfalkiaceae bacterium]|nr:TetR/AcrR family transcriptional regulator [Christensenellaceae bacterium]